MGELCKKVITDLKGFALEVTNFKCGHDAPIYTVVEEIVEHSGTPYFCFKDIDENKPVGSIKIRVETIGYFLRRYCEDLVAAKKKQHSIAEQLKEFEQRLRRQLLKERLAGLEREQEKVLASLDQGALPQIHVPVAVLAASRPVAAMPHAAGD